MKPNILLFLPNDFDVQQIPQLDYYQFYIVKEKDIIEGSKDQTYYSYVSSIQRETKSVSWVSIGDVSWARYLLDFPFEYRKKWIHRGNFEGWNGNEINFCYFISSFGHRNDKANPLISVFTTTFHSGEKIKRPLHSLQKQTYRNWEWIIWDDSKDDKTYQELLEIQKKDIRIQVYKAHKHSGFIGEMKKISCGVAKGSWLVELDHDDPISPHLFQTIVEIQNQYPETEFIHSDYAVIREDSKTDTDYGGDYYTYGYGSHLYQWSSDGTTERYYLTLTNPIINASNIRYIVGVPNHVRIWKTSLYHKINGHNANLPVVDDYELLLRTFLETKNWVRIPECMYFQYQNSGGDNFTNHRNALIQHITRWTAYLYEEKIHKRLLELGIKDERMTDDVAWKRTFFETPYFGKIFDRSKDDLTIIIPFEGEPNEVEEIKRTLEAIFQQKDKRWKIYLISNHRPEIRNVVEWIVSHHRSHASKVDWWNMRERSNTYVLLNYILKMYITNVEWDRYVMYLKSGMTLKDDFVWRFMLNKNEVRETEGRKGIWGWIHPMKMLEQQLWREEDHLDNLNKI
jgi:glycosyltransferase involved in cell wall biosynthesis